MKKCLKGGNMEKSHFNACYSFFKIKNLFIQKILIINENVVKNPVEPIVHNFFLFTRKQLKLEIINKTLSVYNESLCYL